MHKKILFVTVLGLVLFMGIVPTTVYAEETTFHCAWINASHFGVSLTGCFAIDADFNCADEDFMESNHFCFDNYKDSTSCSGKTGTCTSKPTTDGSSPSDGSAVVPVPDSNPTTPSTSGSGSQSFTITNFLNVGDVDELIGKIVTFLTLAAGSVLVVMILFGAFQVMTSGGNPENLKKGRNTIIWSLIGFAIILLAGGVGALIANILGGTADTLSGGAATSTIDTPEGVIGVIDTIASWMFGILMALGTVFVLYSAFLFLISGGDTEKVGTARRALVYAIAALVIGVLAGGVELAIRSIFAGV